MPKFLDALWGQPAAPKQKPANWKIENGQIVERPQDHYHRAQQQQLPTRKKRHDQSAFEVLPFAELLQYKDFPTDGLQHGLVPIGLKRRTNEFLSSSWERMTTGIIAGKRNFGKSTIIKAFLLYALHARANGLKCKINLFDPHHNLPDSLGLFCKPILHQFDQVFLGLKSLQEGRHLTLFGELLELVKGYQKDGFDQAAPWHFIFVDEADLFFQDKEHGKETYELIRDLINLRKGRIFFLLSFADTTKAGSGKVGTGIVTAGAAVFCVNYDMTRARIILQGTNEPQKAINLARGFAVCKLPDSKAFVCRMPLVTAADLTPFLN